MSIMIGVKHGLRHMLIVQTLHYRHTSFIKLFAQPSADVLLVAPYQNPVCIGVFHTAITTRHNVASLDVSQRRNLPTALLLPKVMTSSSRNRALLCSTMSTSRSRLPFGCTASGGPFPAEDHQTCSPLAWLSASSCIASKCCERASDEPSAGHAQAVFALKHAIRMTRFLRKACVPSV